MVFLKIFFLNRKITRKIIDYENIEFYFFSIYFLRTVVLCSSPIDSLINAPAPITNKGSLLSTSSSFHHRWIPLDPSINPIPVRLLNLTEARKNRDSISHDQQSFKWCFGPIWTSNIKMNQFQDFESYRDCSSYKEEIIFVGNEMLVTGRS